jgi:uncharacterized protein YecE (DUF72 family)
VPVLVGTSGWQYRHWRTSFYPPDVAQTRWLEHYAERFAAVEVNATFYRLPAERTVAGWAERTPPDMVLAVKASRYLTHLRRLREPEGPVALLLERARPLGAKLGPILVQLPPDLEADPPALDRALAAFPAGVRVAVEPRHDSWFSEEVRSILAARGAALCLSDRRGPLGPCWRTAGWGYLRLHEGRGRPVPCYAEDALEDWARRLAATWGPEEDVFVFFNNDARCCAVRDAVRFAEAAARAGLRPTRVPSPAEVRVAA